jgi:hypothetical protein
VVVDVDDVAVRMGVGRNESDGSTVHNRLSNQIDGKRPRMIRLSERVANARNLK